MYEIALMGNVNEPMDNAGEH